MSYQTNFKNTIWAGSADQPFQHADVFELPLDAGVSTQPGKLVTITDDVFVNTFASTIFDNALVVLEEGSDVGGTIDETFDGEQVVKAAFPRSGELFNGLVSAAEETSKGVLYTHDENGYFTFSPANDSTQQKLFMCMETTAASAEDRLVLFKKL